MNPIKFKYKPNILQIFKYLKDSISFILAVAPLILLPLELFASEHSSKVSEDSSSKSNVELLFTSKELKWLEEKQVVSYVYDPDWAPFEWKNDINKHTGIIADVLSLIKKRGGIELIAVNTDTWDESVELVKSKKVDMFSAITQNSSREDYLNFSSKDIYTYPAALITKFDDKKVYLNVKKDFEGKKVGIVKGSGLGQYIKEKYPSLDYVELDATQDGFSFMRNNKIDMFAINTVTAKYYIEKKGFDDLKIALKLDYLYHLKIAIRKDLPSEILSVLDKSLSSIREEELNDIFNKWTEIAIEQQTDWKLLFRIMGALFIVILLLYEVKRLQISNKLKQKVNELDIALEQMQQANNAKTLFLANVSHEIRTPINGVLGMIQVLSGTELNDEQKHYLEALDSSSKLLLSLIDDLLDLSKNESGKLILDIEPFDLFTWVIDIQNLAEPLFENKKTIFTTNVSDNLPVCLEGDAARLLQVVVNLLTNSEKYTHDGEVKLTIGGELITENQFNLQVTIKDTGIGIPNEKLNIIFEAFQQIGTDRALNKGVGLGLAICKRLTDIMGGSLEVTSELGKGSCFTFSTTLLVPKKSSHIENTKEKFNINRKLSILLVDDEQINRLAARTLLEQAGHKVVEAENGLIAIEKIKLQSFDIILMDVHMPEMDGVTATRVIREGNTNAKQVPIIGVTASVMKDEKELYFKAGMNVVVEKPIVSDKLIKTIQKLL